MKEYPEEIMLDSVSFNTHNVYSHQQHSEDFFNSPGFIRNELSFITHQINEDDQAFKRGQEEIKKATEGS